tara:strand:+ start:321 stop:902 length:582 start_codon:yes stop_codon:yes gene_type:complete
MNTTNIPKRNFVFFLLAVMPFIALIALLTWGQFRTDNSLSKAISHSEFMNVPNEYRLAADFTGNDLYTGKLISLNTFSENKVTMVTFWSSWCVSCKSEAAQIARLYEEYEDSPVQFIGISIWDETDDAYRYIEKFAVQYPNILDSSGSIAVAYGVRGVPEKFFINSKGRVVHQINGPSSSSSIRTVVDSLLAS